MLNLIQNIIIKEELGAIYTPEKTTFRIWSPTAENVSLNLFQEGTGDNLIKTASMSKRNDGLWSTEINENLSGVYYTYSITINGTTNEVVDIYAKAVGINGYRGMIVNLKETDPQHFRGTPRPAFDNITDAVIYEVHVRDFSIDKSSRIKIKGKFLGFTELETKNDNGDYTGLSHLKELGVTHVHLLPSFDYESVDESSDKSQFNWGYDPKNYNTPEGSYSTNARNGAVRIKEMKELVKALHKNGIRVIMDVVYNHTYKSENSIFNLTVPDYYYRTENGKFTDGSACGNETASDHLMMRKFMLDSVKYWAEEYMIDGFRFDLMGLHDATTMNMISSELKEIDPSIFVYGEGWTGGYSPLPDEDKALKCNASKTPEIAYFSDDIRDTIKGSIFEMQEPGFVNGMQNLEENLRLCITGSINTNLIDYSKATIKPWAISPCQVINYCEAHDNLTLWDKLYYSASGVTVEDRKRMDKLSAAIVFLSQGVPFIQAGQEFLRSKPNDYTGTSFAENSYNSPDSVNSIKWNRKTEYKDVYNYYKGLIELRKAHSLFRMTTKEQIENHLSFIDNCPENTVAFILKGDNEEITVIFNANKETTAVNIPDGKWNVILNDNTAGNNIINSINSERVEVPPISAMVLIR